jgi:hypothetical protein
VLEELGRGGMSVVYKARHLALKRTVALKMVRSGGQAGEEERVRFRSEVEAVARLQYPNIVQVYEVGDPGGLPFCALELVEGGSLAGRLQEGPLKPRQAAALVETLAQAMHLMHSRNVVHRDLKPANILLTAAGVPKVTDFGLAKQLDADSGQTLSCVILGTPNYVAPEQPGGRGKVVGPAADVYALGAILYAALTGQPPFAGDDVLQTLEQVKTREPASPRKLQPGVPRDLETVCLKCLRKGPESRYPSARELADDLGRFLRGEPVLARPVGAAVRLAKWVRRRPAAAALLVTLAALAAATAAELVYRRLEADEADKLLGPAADKLLAALAGETDTAAQLTLAGTLTLLADRLGPENAAAVAPRLLDAIADQKDAPTRSYWINAMARLAPRMGAKGAAAAAAKLAAAFANETDANSRFNLAIALAALGPRLNAEEAAAPARKLLDSIARETASDALVNLARATAALADSMPADEVGRTAEAAAARLLDAPAREREPGQLSALLDAVTALTARMPPEPGRKVAGDAALRLLDALPKVFSPSALHALPGRGVEEFAKRLGPEEAAAVRKALDALGKAVDRDTPPVFAAVVAALAARLEAKDAAAAGRKLLDRMARPADPYILAACAAAVAALAGRMDKDEARKVAAQAAARLLDPLAKEANSFGVYSLCSRLAMLARWLRPEDAAAAAKGVLNVIAKATDPGGLAALADAVTALADRMPAEEGRKVAAAAVVRLLNGVARAPFPPTRLEWLDTVLARGDWHSTEDLVEVLKQPTCVGPARVAVLRELRRRIGPPAPEAAGLAVGLAANPYPPALGAAPVAVHTAALSPAFAARWEAADRLGKLHPQLNLASPTRGVSR